ncbi:hypothetical protein [Streptomyces sp. BE133]|uniref:hypothetical protein n=1 Tax=Streptomyces sp. BE133 TaxID=3002523 RepID=UPI002E76B8A9|nr:hypothetical protein [Streptomyces sp. BE133]MEE1806983.1 hypothetical protein [Streptomyces sp. BE133]
MLIMSGRRTPGGGRVGGVALVLLVGALSTSCGLVPQHPDDEALVLGFRVTDRTVEVKIPVCPGDKLSRVEVWDPGNETKKEQLLWWGETPIAEGSDNGLLRLWSPADYRKSSAAQKPSNLPPLIDVSAAYADQEDSVGDLISLDEATKKQQPDEYWTIKGKSMSAQEIDEQLSCPK